MTWSLHESLWKVQGPESLIFQTYVTFSIDSQNIHITIICFSMLLNHFFRYFGKRRRFLPPGAYSFITSSLHIPGYCFLTKYDKIMS